MKSEDVFALLRLFKKRSSDEYRITKIGVFGSFARASEDSDVDIVFETDSPNLFRTARMRAELASLFKRRVDVARFRAKMIHDQTGILDANADGVQTKEDVTLVRDFIIGRGRVAASTPPSIGAVSDEQTLSTGTTAALQAWDIISLNKIEMVWAVIVPPDFENGSDEEVTNLDTIELTDPDQDGKYTGTFNGFTQPGAYRITIHAKDEKGQISLPKTTTVIQQNGILPGDIDGDGKVDLADAVLGLKICVGAEAAAMKNADADVNGDGRIGMPEVIYAMRKAGGF